MCAVAARSTSCHFCQTILEKDAHIFNRFHSLKRALGAFELLEGILVFVERCGELLIIDLSEGLGLVHQSSSWSHNPLNASAQIGRIFGAEVISHWATLKMTGRSVGSNGTPFQRRLGTSASAMRGMRKLVEAGQVSGSLIHGVKRIGWRLLREGLIAYLAGAHRRVEQRRRDSTAG
jgi:hypothetical protein